MNLSRTVRYLLFFVSANAVLVTLLGGSSFAEKWDIATGPLSLTVQQDRVSGTYPFFNAQVEGLLSNDGKFVTGTWQQSNGITGGFKLSISPLSKRIEGRRWTGEKRGNENGGDGSEKRIGEPQFRDSPSDTTQATTPVESRNLPSSASPPNSSPAITQTHRGKVWAKTAGGNDHSYEAVVQRPSTASTTIDSVAGEWRVVEFKRNGQSGTDKTNTVYRFDSGRVTVQVNGKPSADLRYTIDTSKSPHHLDLILGSSNGNDLVTCDSPPGQARPDSFAAEEGSGNTVFRMLRMNAPWRFRGARHSI